MRGQTAPFDCEGNKPFLSKVAFVRFCFLLFLSHRDKHYAKYSRSVLVLAQRSADDRPSRETPDSDGGFPGSQAKEQVVQVSQKLTLGI